MMKLFKNEKGMKELRETLEKEFNDKLICLRTEKDNEIKEMELKNKLIEVKGL